MVRWIMLVGASLFVAGSVLAFLVVFSRLPGIEPLSVFWFAIGVGMAAIGYLVTVIENFLRYETTVGGPFR